MILYHIELLLFLVVTYNKFCVICEVYHLYKLHSVVAITVHLKSVVNV